MLSLDDVRAMFASSLSEMYQREVPQYGTLLSLVANINHNSAKEMQPRVECERHGAIRLGLPKELAMMRRLFNVMGMEPVDYYDLAVAGLPVHATGFRPIHSEALQRNPFRVFASLLRLDLILDKTLRQQAADILQTRRIFTPRCIELLERFEAGHPFTLESVQEFIQESLHTFRWHETAHVEMATYKSLEAVHPLIADIVCFKGPHINHLTPRVVDIDTAHADMKEFGLEAKDIIEGPPSLQHDILLRQTSFLALEEVITFPGGAETAGRHRARFGEIEQRGMALTPKGRLLYDQMMTTAQHLLAEKPELPHESILREAFALFPQDLEIIRQEKIAYFRYSLKCPAKAKNCPFNADLLVASGILTYAPITYEDFLPASAAGIFKSNLNGAVENIDGPASNQASFEEALGRRVHDPFKIYQELEDESLSQCIQCLL